MCDLALQVEFMALSLASLLLLLQTRKHLCKKEQTSWVATRTTLFIIILALSYSQLTSIGRPVLLSGISMPGSLLTRWLNLSISVWIRRLIEPSLWIFAAGIFLAAHTSKFRKARALYLFTFVTTCILTFFEGITMHPTTQEILHSNALFEQFMIFSHSFLTHSSLLTLILALTLETIRINRHTSALHLTSTKSTKWTATCVLLTGILVLVGGLSFQRILTKKTHLLVGAHYYLWFPENWSHGYIGNELRPQITPALGEYSSKSIDTFAQHMTWAKEAGINFFIFDWWPERPSTKRRMLSYIKDKELWQDFKFAVHYETLDLKTFEKTAISGEDTNILVANEDRGHRMKLHWEHLAKHFMSHKSYLRINNRPVLFLYATRHVVGDVAKMVLEARLHVKAKTGVDLYLVGDEVFFNVITMNKKGSVTLRKNLVPEWDRLLAFDALTAYNPYDSTRKLHAGEKGANKYIEDVAELYKTYQSIATTAGLLFVPSVLPGYNDRGVRLHENHFVIPRQFGEQTSKSFFTESLQRLALPFLDDFTPMFTITSWNEWNEATQIEPSRISSPTINDNSVTGSLYSGLSLHEGYGCAHLEELHNVIEALEN